MNNNDLLVTLREASLQKEMDDLERETYQMCISCLLMEHIIKCEDEGRVIDYREVLVPEYPSCSVTAPHYYLHDTFDGVHSSMYLP